MFYGAAGAFKVATGLSGSVACGNGYFGNPLNGVTKHCSYTVTGGVPGGLAAGATGALGPFVPHHFDVALSQGCGNFTYSGQPFSVTVTARNAANATTRNYDGGSATAPNQAKAVTLAAQSNAGVGSFNGTGMIGAGSFASGVALVSTPAFTYTHKLTESLSVTVGANNADGVSSTGHAQGILGLRSGRLKVSNVFGPGAVSLLRLPVQAQYWTGRAWALNDLDHCSSVPASAMALSSYRDGKGAATSAWSTAASALTIAGGHGGVTFTAPSAGGTGSVDVALNLGLATADQSCLANHPVTVGGAAPWLRSQYGSTAACAAAHDRDPSARVTFGVYSPESRKNMYARESF
ncbi:MAG: hypothetical protein EOP40_09730 [Rubrivivax sp.]|nr:MAG: hypothetical protein EOP40_09730 [Rubrivivax sp.]